MVDANAVVSGQFCRRYAGIEFSQNGHDLGLAQSALSQSPSRALCPRTHILRLSESAPTGHLPPRAASKPIVLCSPVQTCLENMDNVSAAQGSDASDEPSRGRTWRFHYRSPGVPRLRLAGERSLCFIIAARAIGAFSRVRAKSAICPMSVTWMCSEPFPAPQACSEGNRSCVDLKREGTAVATGNA